MNKEKTVDYLKALRSFEIDQGRKPEDTDLPLQNSTVPDGGVDYLAAVREYDRQTDADQPALRRGKN